MNKGISHIYAAVLLLAACSSPKIEEHLSVEPIIFPDYTHVTFPLNMAPPAFSVGNAQSRAIFSAGRMNTAVKSDSKGSIRIGEKDWRKLLQQSDTVTVTLQARNKDGRWNQYKAFPIYISQDSIDSHLAYRLIEPGYELWNEMGIYQRNLESYQEKPIATNNLTNYGCMNCHSFCNRNPKEMLFHMRVDYAGTYFLKDGELERFNTKTDSTISALVYPQWHPSGDFVAFTVNDTKQMFHTTDPNRIEVYDNASDVIIYDVKENRAFSSPLLKSNDAFETFPTFSPDGNSLFFCTSASREMPAQYDSVKYSLCRIDFEPSSRSFGADVDTLVNASQIGHSVSFPRVSPDGRWMLYTLADYGNFSIWHRDADLWILDLETGESRSVDEVNSAETESYHSWSSNGKWIVFSSRRDDGLYTRPYFAHVNENGEMSKPFILPQADADYYKWQLKSYNVPEFIAGEVELTPRKVATAAKTAPLKQVSF